MQEAKSLGPARLAGTESFLVRSAILSDPLIIDVAHPVYPLGAGMRMPVIYVLDGDLCFALAAQSARSQQLAPGAFPQALVVGIRYDLDNAPDRIARRAGLRFRDFTRSVDETYIARMREAPPPFTLPEDVSAGSAERFFSFLSDELIPFVSSRYDADPADRTLVGVSLSGLFALETLLSGATQFHRYVAISPSLWWNDRAIFKTDFREEGMIQNARLFLGVGELEEAEDQSAHMVSNLEALAARLVSGPYRGLAVTHQVFGGESHLSVAPAGLARGLREVFRR